MGLLMTRSIFVPMGKLLGLCHIEFVLFSILQKDTFMDGKRKLS